MNAAKKTVKAPQAKIKEAAPKRKSVRFQPEVDALACIDFNIDKKNFEAEISGLVVDESFHGACIILRPHDKIREGTKLNIQIGRLAPIAAEVRWRKDHSTKIMEIGLSYLE